MRDGVSSLTGRERETLRLLLAGHDAKSMARQLDLSVHTINERLRDARRKLGVSSSREAARRLAEAEGNGPDFLADKGFGVPDECDDEPRLEQAEGRRDAPARFAWFSGGMFIMSLVIAAIIGTVVLQGGGTPAFQTPAGQEARGSAAPAQSSSDPSRAAALDAARSWLALLDGERWTESWRVAMPLFRSLVPEAQWVSTIRALREQLGGVSSRAFHGVTTSRSLPGLPDGTYEVIQFQTAFANKDDAVETITLAREGSGWKTVGYVIR